MKNLNKPVTKKSNVFTINKVAIAIAIAGSLSATAIAGNQYASDSFSHYDYARVVNVNKVIEKVKYNEPVEKCWDEKVRYQTRHAKKHSSKTPDVIGAIVGAAVGNRFGSGSGRDVATVAGAVLGGSIGRDVRKSGERRYADDHYGVKTVRQCKTHHEVRYEEKLAGYEVQYRYKDKVFTTQMNTHPGNEIKVQVTVVPVQ